MILLLAVLLLMPCSAWAEDPAGDFAVWYLSQEWTAQERHAWESIFDALTDGRDRSPQARHPIQTPAFVAIVSGKAYHLDENCSGLRRAHTVVEMDEAETIQRGFEMCGRCE